MAVMLTPAHTPPHALPPEAALRVFESHGERGLSAAEAQARVKKHGTNELREAPPAPAWKRLLAHFTELVVLILIGAAALSGIMGDFADAIAILAIVLLNGILGFLQEDKARKALAALQKLAAPLVKVFRDGRRELLPAKQIAPGDIVDLEAGDHVPADARLLDGGNLRVQEAALTGESVPVEKDWRAELPAATPLAERRNMAHMGTVVSAGRARALVVATGMSTELGRIAGLLQHVEAAPTPLQRKLSELGRTLVVVCLVLVALIFAMRMARGGGFFETLMTSVSLAVAAVPEGLPAVVTLALALGLQRMVKRHALVRKLPSVETLGAVTVICSDKTGTLTRNEMTVRVVIAGGARHDVSGAGYAPEGDFTLDGKVIDPQRDPALLRALHTAVRCNSASLHQKKTGGGWEVIGDPTEGALLAAARKAGVEPPPARTLAEIHFDSDRKAMSVIAREDSGRTVMHTKGAPEVLLKMCSHIFSGAEALPLNDERRERVLRQSAELAGSALRVLAVAEREDPDFRGGAFVEEGLVFEGLFGMIDPPREEAKAAVSRCREAGIRPVMITGDHPVTALALARELGIAGAADRAVSGGDLDALTDEALSEQMPGIAVCARVTAEHKLRIIKALKKRGEITAMTGDGVNDAPAIRCADIGIAMGLTGSDVTKEASAMVLTDDNFASIVNAIEEGRGIYDNIRKFLQYLLATNAGEVLLLFFAAMIGWPVPLAAIQILWINLVTDGLPALALAMEPPEPDIMRRPPRPPRQPVIGRGDALRILACGLMVAAAAAAGFAILCADGGNTLGRARTAAFCITAFAQLALAFGFRSRRYTLPQLGVFSNRYLLGAILLSALLQAAVVLLPFAQPLVGAGTLSPGDWGLIAGLSLLPVTLLETAKMLFRKEARAAAL
jgi:Ca2+-transporting ATPase